MAWLATWARTVATCLPEHEYAFAGAAGCRAVRLAISELPTCFPAVEQIERTEQDASLRVLAIQWPRRDYRGQGDKAGALAVSALADLDPTVRIAAADALRSLHATSASGALNRALQVEGDDTAREHLREAVRVLRLPSADADNDEAQ